MDPVVVEDVVVMRKEDLVVVEEVAVLHKIGLVVVMDSLPAAAGKVAAAELRGRQKRPVRDG
eukprot:CAMPEP_0184704194 /NCGR_PEP_ID=MMETSP0313-20130426/30405_1 /TAXON_ID=2792 /ORGANISM="Porphyridium aerugineum, Strain SAG 1380-2" /LENGTH=61 /DNA_ID=CAMNT_0027165169 /DNA_START=24 /DNA_END=205 /DNA_ORIENTATION=+